MIRLRAGNRQGAGSTPGAYSETTRPSLADARGQLGVRGRVVAVDAAAEHGDRAAARLERAAVRLAVDSTREAADDDETRPPPAPGRAAARPAIRTTSRLAPPRSPLRVGREARRSPAPRRKSPGGGSCSSRSSDGYVGSERPTKRDASARRAQTGMRPRRRRAGTARSVARAAQRPRGGPSRPRRRRAARSLTASPAPWASGRRAPRRHVPCRPPPRRQAARSFAPRVRPAPARGPRAATARPRGSAIRSPPSTAERLASHSRACVGDALAHCLGALAGGALELPRTRPRAP